MRTVENKKGKVSTDRVRFLRSQFKVCLLMGPQNFALELDHVARFMRGKLLVQKMRRILPPREVELLEKLFNFLGNVGKVSDFNRVREI